MRYDLFGALERLPAVGILRGCPSEHIEMVAEVAAAAGFAAFEVTLDSPDPFDALGRLRARFPELVVGAGTVRTVEEADRAAESGAAFLVSPLVDEAVIAAAGSRELPILPGAATPTEVWRAVQAGAAAVKLFPAVQLGGPAYVRAISGPLGNPRLVPTGGVSSSNARCFLEAGAWALGVGGSVFPRDALTAGDAARVGSMASAFVVSIT